MCICVFVTQLESVLYVSFRSVQAIQSVMGFSDAVFVSRLRASVHFLVEGYGVHVDGVVIVSGGEESVRSLGFLALSRRGKRK